MLKAMKYTAMHAWNMNAYNQKTKKIESRVYKWNHVANLMAQSVVYMHFLAENDTCFRCIKTLQRLVFLPTVAGIECQVWFDENLIISWSL